MSSSPKDNYDDRFVVCPFFVSGHPLSVTCEGICEGGNLKVMFPNVSACIDHRLSHCESIEGYDSCPLYLLALKKYEDGAK